MVGAMIVLQRLRISPDAAFRVNDWSALVIFMVVIGGPGSFEGPNIGAVVYFLLRETLASLGAFDLIIPGFGRDHCHAERTTRIVGGARSRWNGQLLPLNFIVSGQKKQKKVARAIALESSRAAPDL
jgi:branched-chain amino acid transport system permease protein